MTGRWGGQNVNMSRQGLLLVSKSIKICNTEEVGSKRIRYIEVAFVMKGFCTLDTRYTGVEQLLLTR